MLTKVHGNNSQILETFIEQSDVLYAEPSALLSIDPYIKIETSFSTTTTPHKKSFFKSLFSIIKRKISGENIALVKYTNQSFGEGVQSVLLAPTYPGEIAKFHVSENQGIFCRRDRKYVL